MFMAILVSLISCIIWTQLTQVLVYIYMPNVMLLYRMNTLSSNIAEGPCTGPVHS